ncbi:MAG: ferrous iron transport protein B [Gemmatimonadota bacterium]|nr:ferrous iron transport protein B [Gemmatimonadota bacterium]
MRQAEKKPGVLKVAVTGNPNSGKTAIFNTLTGFSQRVSNYPGVTVEKKEGEVLYRGQRLLLMDLPGAYSLTSYSIEEMDVRKYILEEKPDVILDVLDANNLERNLFLATQLMEFGIPLVLALNMSDEARSRGIEFDLRKLSALIGAPLVPTVGNKGEGRKELLEAVVKAASEPVRSEHITVNYGRDIEGELEGLEKLLDGAGHSAGTYNPRWLTVKLLEGDREVLNNIGDENIISAAKEAATRLESLLGERPEIIMGERRYGFISGACQETMKTTVETRHNMSDRIDDIIMSEALGIPILLLLMYLVFYLTFTLGNAPGSVLEYIFGRLSLFVSSFWPTGSHSPIKSLLTDGIIGGVGGVVVFLPNIMILFFCIALLEDTGYTSRAVFVMDRLMHRMGLHGKSFIPLIIGFGCSVPAILATRSLESRRDRLVTMMIIPLMSCGGRHPIFALIIPVFFVQRWQVPVLWLIYVTGMVLAVFSARLLAKTVLKGFSEPFVMELPPYRIPTWKSVIFHMWEPSYQFLKKAGTVIFAASIILWALAAFPRKKEFDMDYTAAALEVQEAFTDGLVEVGGLLHLTPEGKEMLIARLTGRMAGTDPALAAFKARAGHEAAVIDEFLRAVDELERQRKAGIDPSPSSHGAGTEVDAGGGGSGEYFSTAAVSFYLEGVKYPRDENLARITKLKKKEQLSYSIAGKTGRALAQVLKPLGFDWKVSTAFLGGFAAKELFIAQMGIIYAVEESGQGKHSLREQVRKNYSPLSAVCIMIFLLIGTPCIATLAVTRQESGSWGWVLLQWGGLTGLAYIVTLVVFQVGSFLGIGVV